MYRALIVLSFAFALATAAQAHEVEDNMIELSVTGYGDVTGQWKIPVSDLEDMWQPSGGTAGERAAAAAAHKDEILAAVHDDLALSAGKDETCPIAYGPQGAALLKERPYVVLPFTAKCSNDSRGVGVKWTFLNEAEHKRQALINFTSPGGSQAAILTRGEQELRFGMIGKDAFAHFKMYVHDGMMHIWTGIDHILFLLTLILPAVFFLRQKKWEARGAFRDTGVEIVKTVSAFTLAHSLTLCLVTFHLLTLPPRLVESVIAFSVLLVGLNNIFPVIHEGRWKLAFLFGLVHGIGFAEVLADLQLPTGTLINSLLGFNLGVEIGQLSIVGVTLPLAFALRRTLFYRQFVFFGGSVAASCVAALWLVDRVLNLEFMPF